MNRIETWFCGTAFWRSVTRRQLLPWVLRGAQLGDCILELGAGPGAATPELSRMAAKVISLDYDGRAMGKLVEKVRGSNAKALQGDAAALPFPGQTFSSAISILMLHHMRSPEEQDKAFAEIFRVLRPGGLFLAFEITDGWFNRVLHTKSTFVPMAPSGAFTRLTLAGFSRVSVDYRRGGFRLCAFRGNDG